jgi:hypothetical protein
MLAALLLAISRCASADLCPDDATLIAALRRRDEAIVAAMSARMASEQPDSFATYHPDIIEGVSEVICGEALPGDLPTVTCKFTVRYPRRNAYQVARLARKDGMWEIEAALVVTRDRR